MENPAGARNGARIYAEDTIAALSTPAARDGGDGAIGVIRLSGPDAFGIAGRIFRGKKSFDEIKPYAIGYGFIYDAGAAIDEVLILKMRAPRSYTREDMVEVHCHAGAGVQRGILRLLLREGARAAEPGEFTKRAFLNGRLDLSQAEAVMDLIRSKSDAGASVAMRQLEGALSVKLGASRDEIIGLIASLEVFLDFPEYDAEEHEISDICGAIEGIEKNLRTLAASFEYGRAAREGVTAVIAGRPNVGKSTLLNLLAGRDRAIVTDTPGTTRDIIDEYIYLGGFTVRFLDTAGIRDTDDAVEKIGVERAVGAIDRADLAIILFSAPEGFGDEDVRLIRLTEGKKRVFIINKTDLESPETVNGIRSAINRAVAASDESAFAVSGSKARAATEAIPETRAATEAVPEARAGEDSAPETLGGEDTAPEALAGENSAPETFGGEDTAPETLAGEETAPEALAFTEATAGACVVTASLIAGIGLTETESAVRAAFYGKYTPGDADAVIANARHFTAVTRGLGAIRAAKAALLAGLPYEMPIIDMREALNALGEITGDTYSEDIIDRIFSDFCVGK